MKKLVIPLLFAAVLLAGCIGGGPSQTQEQQAGPAEQAAAAMVMSPFGLMLSEADAAGQDLECIGRPPGTVRGYYTKTEDTGLGETSVTIVYYKKGTDADSVKQFVESKAQECGWKKTSESSGSVSTPGFQIVQGYSLEYEKQDTSLGVDIIAAKTSGGNEEGYTFIEFTVNEHSGEQGTAAQQETTTTEEESGFGAVTEPSVTDADAQKYDNLLKPVFQKVFGSTKLSAYAAVEGEQKMITLEYVLEQGAQASKLADLKNELSQALNPEGFSNIVSTVTSDSFIYSYKGLRDSTITVSGAPGENKVSVTILLGS